MKNIQYAKMGNEESKAQVNHNGDTHVEIINTQTAHGEKLEFHELMLWYIIIVTSLMCVIQVTSMLKTVMNKKVTKKARSMVELAENSNRV